MRDALKRLRALQRQLENTHRLTSELLLESRRLIAEFEQVPPAPEKNLVPAAGAAQDKPARSASRRGRRKR